jgi:hypothetical protein
VPAAGRSLLDAAMSFQDRTPYRNLLGDAMPFPRPRIITVSQTLERFDDLSQSAGSLRYHSHSRFVTDS